MQMYFHQYINVKLLVQIMKWGMVAMDKLIDTYFDGIG